MKFMAPMHSTLRPNSQVLIIFFVSVAAVLYGLFLASLPVDKFVDRNNYLAYAVNSSEIFDRYLAQGWLSVLFNEPVWLGVNIFLGGFLSPENTLRAIIFFSSSLTAFVVLKYNTRYFFILILVLILPQVIKNNIIHLRQGLAIAIFLYAWFAHGCHRRYVLFICSCLIHSSFFVIVFLMAVDYLLLRFRLSAEIRAAVVFVGGVLISFFGVWLAGILGARQAILYVEGAGGMSGLAFLFWTVVAMLFFMQGKEFLRRNSMSFSLIIFYLSTYFLLPVAARVFESGIILVLLSALGLTHYRKYIFLSALIFYFFVQWSARLVLPYAGWGIENYI